MKIFRRRSAPAARGAGGTGGARVAVRSRVDSVRDAVQAGAVRRSYRGLLRWIGLIASGRVALVGAVLTYVFGRIIGGLPVLLMAYGLGALLIASFFLARRRLRMEGERSGLYPRAQQGD